VISYFNNLVKLLPDCLQLSQSAWKLRRWCTWYQHHINLSNLAVEFLNCLFFFAQVFVRRTSIGGIKLSSNFLVRLLNRSCQGRRALDWCQHCRIIVLRVWHTYHTLAIDVRLILGCRQVKSIAWEHALLVPHEAKLIFFLFEFCSNFAYFLAIVLLFAQEDLIFYCSQLF